MHTNTHTHASAQKRLKTHVCLFLPECTAEDSSIVSGVTSYRLMFIPPSAHFKNDVMGKHLKIACVFVRCAETEAHVIGLHRYAVRLHAGTLALHAGSQA